MSHQTFGTKKNLNSLFTPLLLLLEEREIHVMMHSIIYIIKKTKITPHSLLLLTESPY